ncbi:HCV F-transactivated protein 1 [Phyllostomus discolor]|uniref:HCV F-transactivated protein 1 n=1 Tax=Phyllostomus discolor TaxID=89673 RepID=A0A833ZGS4_9CHIR|nr:HCV F-transactivated protein 1 [Phyllostomus discolor]
MAGRAAAGGDPDGPRERRGPGGAARPQQNHQAPPQRAAGRLPKHSYWLDLWLFVLVDLALFLLVYLWP